MERSSPRRNDRVAFIVMSGLLTLYVALCTGQRDNHLESDAWEHHRAIVALARDLKNPGNPTFATDDASIRYSPYSAGLAIISRSSGWDPYAVLSGAAVGNTVLLLLGVWLFLHRLGATSIAPAFLIVMVSLYGGAPGYAGSFALADLPLHQVNPSAFATALALFSFVALDRMLASGWSWPIAAGISLLTAIGLLSHGMTGLFTGMGLISIALLRGAQPIRAVLWVIGISLAATALALFWPLYDLSAALFRQPENDYWFNPRILRSMLLEWCLPPLLAALFALPFRDKPVVQIGLVGGSLCFLTGVAALLTHSPTMARLPLAGVLFLHFAAATFVCEAGLLQPSTWPGRLRRIGGDDRVRSGSALAEVLVALSIVYFGVPQLWAVMREPHLARAYVAPLFGKENRQLDLKKRYDSFLEDVGQRDVVLADGVTSWPIPSSHGLIVTAIHWEFFSGDQARRQADVEAFFSKDPDVDLPEILDRYEVLWIFLNRNEIGDDRFEELLEPAALVRRDGDWALMGAAEWRASREDP